MQQLRLKKAAALFFATFVAAGFFALPNQAAASGSGTVNLSSSCTNCEVGSTVNVTVSATATSGTIGAVEVNLNFDKAKLQYQSIAYFSGANDFSDILSESINQTIGAIHVEAGKQGGLPSGTGNIFTASFKVLAAGSASFTAAPIDGANQDGRVSLTANSLNLTFSNPTVVNPPQNGTNPPASSGTTNPTTTPQTATANYNKSEVTFDKASAVADGTDKICATVTVKNGTTIISNLKPSVKTEGGVDLTEITLAANKWSFCISSTAAGSKRIIVYIKNTTIKDQGLAFTAPVAATAAPEEVIVSNDNDLANVLKKIIGNAAISAKKDFFNRRSITDVDLIRVYGTAKPDAKVRIYVHSPLLITKEVIADDQGNWEVVLDNPLSVGAHRVDASVFDSYGNESETKIISRFTVVKSYRLQLSIFFGSIILLLAGMAIFLFLNKKRNKIDQEQPFNSVL